LGSLLEEAGQDFRGHFSLGTPDSGKIPVVAFMDEDAFGDVDFYDSFIFPAFIVD
jgi:hypothetical protein